MSSHAASAARKRATRRAVDKRPPTAFDKISRFAVPAAAVLLVATLVAAGTLFGDSDSGTSNGQVTLGSTAPDFSVPDVVGGGELSRGELEGSPALLFFSEGAACQACNVQTADLQAPLAKAGVQLVTITTDPAEVLTQVAAEYGITTPLLADESRAMSSAYGMLGRGGMGHPDQNGHAFALLDSDGKLVWEQAYSEMYVPSKKILAAVEKAGA